MLSIAPAFAAAVWRGTMVVMVAFIIAVLCLLVALSLIVLLKAYHAVPEHELKRRARHGDATAQVLYRAVAYGAGLRLMVWLLVIVGAAVGMVLLTKVAPLYLSLPAVAGVLALGLLWLPNNRLPGWELRIGLGLTPPVVKLASWLHGPLDRVTQAWSSRYPQPRHNQLYEKEDLQHLIAIQRQQTDSRISPQVLDLLERALQFDNLQVRDILLPRHGLRAVQAGELVGPVLLAELHATGESDFPVYETSPDDITGTLHLVTLNEARQGGRARDYADGNVAFLHESDSLSDMLQAFYQTKKRLFVVINSFGEYSGVVNIETLVQRLLGKPAAVSFEAHSDRQAVAAKHTAAPQEPPRRHSAAAEPGDAGLQSAETVVE